MFDYIILMIYCAAIGLPALGIVMTASIKRLKIHDTPRDNFLRKVYKG